MIIVGLNLEDSTIGTNLGFAYHVIDSRRFQIEIDVSNKIRFLHDFPIGTTIKVYKK